MSVLQNIPILQDTKYFSFVTSRVCYANKYICLIMHSSFLWHMIVASLSQNCLCHFPIYPQMAKALGSTAITHRSDTFASHRCLVDDDTRAFALVYGDHIMRNIAEEVVNGHTDALVPWRCGCNDCKSEQPCKQDIEFCRPRTCPHATYNVNSMSFSSK